MKRKSRSSEINFYSRKFQKRQPVVLQIYFELIKITCKMVSLFNPAIHNVLTNIGHACVQREQSGSRLECRTEQFQCSQIITHWTTFNVEILHDAFKSQQVTKFKSQLRRRSDEMPRWLQRYFAEQPIRLQGIRLFSFDDQISSRRQVFYLLLNNRIKSLGQSMKNTRVVQYVQAPPTCTPHRPRTFDMILPQLNLRCQQMSGLKRSR